MFGLSEELNRMAFMGSMRVSVLYVALIILMGVVLTYVVIFQRRAKRIGLGDGGDKVAARMIRIHGNFCENAPFALAALIALPLVGASAWVCHLVGLLFLAGRAAHAYGLSQSAGTSPGRLVGMILTHVALIFGALALITAAFSR